MYLVHERLVIVDNYIILYIKERYHDFNFQFWIKSIIYALKILYLLVHETKCG